MKVKSCSSILVLLHDALAGSLEVGGVLAVEVAAETAAASVDQLRGDDLDAEAVGDDLKMSGTLVSEFA